MTSAALPVTILNSPSVAERGQEGGYGSTTEEFGTAKDIAGIVLWGVGFLVECWGDFGKVRYAASQLNSGAEMES